MSRHNPGNFADRLENAAKAKQALLESFRNKPDQNDPEVAARLAERKAAAEAREAREIAKREAKHAEIARLKAEKLAAAEAKAAKAREEAARKPAGRARLSSILASHQAMREARKGRA